MCRNKAGIFQRSTEQAETRQKPVGAAPPARLRRCALPPDRTPGRAAAPRPQLRQPGAAGQGGSRRFRHRRGGGPRAPVGHRPGTPRRAAPPRISGRSRQRRAAGSGRPLIPGLAAAPRRTPAQPLSPGAPPTRRAPPHRPHAPQPPPAPPRAPGGRGARPAAHRS